MRGVRGYRYYPLLLVCAIANVRNKAGAAGYNVNVNVRVSRTGLSPGAWPGEYVWGSRFCA